MAQCRQLQRHGRIFRRVLPGASVSRPPALGPALSLLLLFQHFGL